MKEWKAICGILPLDRNPKKGISERRRFPFVQSWILLIGICLLIYEGCTPPSEPQTAPLFTALPPAQTGVTFANTLTESEAFNIIEYLYFYNGGGVAVGDINNDGLPDLYFSANQQPNRLYLNQGNFQFEDITESAGVSGNGDWSTGVSMADVNGDGWLDIYVCQVGGYKGLNGKNQLFINQGDQTFREEASAYGLAFQGFSTQAAFFDYDLDGDLDLYLANHSVHNPDNYDRRQKLVDKGRDPVAGDRLYRQNQTGQGARFTDVSESAGIQGIQIGFGLDVSISDLNKDGCPDIYVSNDFHENDYLYLNNCDGTFSEKGSEFLGHTSTFSMGNDIADLNNDGWPDILSLDMKPANDSVMKRSEGPDPYSIYQFKLSYGYQPQFPRNHLQVNFANWEAPGQAKFGDMAQMMGLDATDWSWSALMADLDNDGRKDVFISNGIPRRPNDLDYKMFTSNRKVQASATNLELADAMPPGEWRNYAFRQEAPFTFADSSASWGLDHPGCTHGAALADLDLDGDLDLITNNLNQPASIYRNETGARSSNHFLRLRFKGPTSNAFGIGATISLTLSGEQIFGENFPTRGFHSATWPVLHFGLGKDSVVRTLTVTWPGGLQQVLRDVKADQEILLDIKNATPPGAPSPTPNARLLTREPNREASLPAHSENSFNDFNRESLIPHLISTQGPAMAVGDVNGDGLDDLYSGKGENNPGGVYLQNRNGTFRPVQQDFWRGMQYAEEVDAAFFDADGDGDLDLYTVCAGNQHPDGFGKLLDRLFLNDGKGIFSLTEGYLPAIAFHGGCVAPGDVEGDGDIDLFIGGRIVPGKYGEAPLSQLLINDGTGHFTDQTESLAPGLQRIGMVCDAVWVPIDEDERMDLVVAGEWMPVTIFLNKGKSLERAELVSGPSSGWWNCLSAADMDNDGDMDLVAGNLGYNAPIQASEGMPVTLHLNDFDRNGQLDPVITHHYRGDKAYPLYGRNELGHQLPLLKKRFPDFLGFCNQPVKSIFSPEEWKGTRSLEVQTFASAYIENRGQEGLVVHPLPPEAQSSPVFGIGVPDLNQDGNPDILLAGNLWGASPHMGRYDASPGWALLGDGKGGFRALWPWESGFFVQGEARCILEIKGAGGVSYLVGRNHDAPLVFK